MYIMCIWYRIMMIIFIPTWSHLILSVLIWSHFFSQSTWKNLSIGLTCHIDRTSKRLRNQHSDCRPKLPSSDRDVLESPGRCFWFSSGKIKDGHWTSTINKEWENHQTKSRGFPAIYVWWYTRGYVYETKTQRFSEVLVRINQNQWIANAFFAHSMHIPAGLHLMTIHKYWTPVNRQHMRLGQSYWPYE